MTKNSQTDSDLKKKKSEFKMEICFSLTVKCK